MLSILMSISSFLYTAMRSYSVFLPGVPGRCRITRVPGISSSLQRPVLTTCTVSIFPFFSTWATNRFGRSIKRASSVCPYHIIKPSPEKMPPYSGASFFKSIIFLSHKIADIEQLIPVSEQDAFHHCFSAGSEIRPALQFNGYFSSAAGKHKGPSAVIAE